VTGPRDPDLIRQDIAATREELGAAVEALAAKADVKARAREKFGKASTRMRERPAVIVAVAGFLVLAVIFARRR
jgi:hypothetical protein